MSSPKYRDYFHSIIFGNSTEPYRSQVVRIYKSLNLQGECTLDSFYQNFKRFKKQAARLKIKEQQKAPKHNAFSGLLNALKPDPNPLGLPTSKESVYTAFKLPKSATDILLLSDIHVPYHNIEALTLALQYGLQHNVNTIILTVT